MNASVFFPTLLHWTAQDLADAVPLRLHELFAFDAASDGAATASANAETARAQATRARPRDYRHQSGLPATFRIR